MAVVAQLQEQQLQHGPQPDSGAVTALHLANGLTTVMCLLVPALCHFTAVGPWLWLPGAGHGVYVGRQNGASICYVLITTFMHSNFCIWPA